MAICKRNAEDLIPSATAMVMLHCSFDIGHPEDVVGLLTSLLLDAGVLIEDKMPAVHYGVWKDLFSVGSPGNPDDHNLVLYPDPNTVDAMALLRYTIDTPRLVTLGEFLQLHEECGLDALPA